MALNFALLDQPTFAQRFEEGRSAVRQENQQRMQNELAQQQAAMRQQEFGMRQQEFARAEEDRKSKLANAERRQQFLTNLSTKMAEGGYKLDRPTLGQMLKFGMETGEDSLMQLATKGLQALDEQEGYEADMVRLGLAPPKATAAPANALAPAAAPFEGEVTNTLGVNSIPLGPRPMPVGNALAAPGVVPAPAPATGKINPAMVQQMILSGNRLTRAQGAALSQMLPKEPATPADVATMQALGYPLTQAGYQAFRDAQRQERMLSPAEEAQRIRISAASRAPAQPVAPTIANIVDPTDPSKMIAIDAKRYQGGGAGSPGVIGVSGKEPSAALRENKAEAGKTQLADDLDNLRASFQKLDQMRAIPSTQRNAVSNLMSATGASGVGQTLGRATGTEAQVERDVINSARQRLVNSIKNATGMSAQQLNSNVELQTMLKSISDPGQSFEAAMRIIDDIDEAYVKGDGKLKKGGAAAPAASAAPARVGGPARAANPGSNLSPAEQAELEQLRQRFRK